MILFDLLCSKGHAFEAWFRDSESFDRLLASGEIQCALCGDSNVKKALMAPNISTSKTADLRVAEESAEKAASASGEKAGDKESAGAAPQPSMAVQENPGALTGPAKLPVPEKVAEALQVLRQMQTHVEKNFDHVGRHFAEEARKMHYGEAEKRSIYGEATREEAEDLAEEGIDVTQMPWLTNRNS